VLEWFKQLPIIPKLVFIGLVVGLVLLALLVWLVFLAFLSPVVGIVFGSLFGVSIIALIIRVAQRRPIRNWAIVAVASVVLMFTFGGISDIVYGGGWGPSSGRGGSGEKVANNPSDGGGASPSTPAGGDYSSPSPSALSVGDEVEFTGEVFGMPEDITYDGRPLTGQVIDVGGEHMMVLADPMQGIIMTGFPGQKMRVHGEYQGPISGSGGGSYDAVLADKVEVLDDQ